MSVEEFSRNNVDVCFMFRGHTVCKFRFREGVCSTDPKIERSHQWDFDFKEPNMPSWNFEDFMLFTSWLNQCAVYAQMPYTVDQPKDIEID